MSESRPVTVPQPLVYLIHDDQDRAVADTVARHLTAAGVPAWCRGQRAPKGQGADIVLKKARAAVLVLTHAATQSQLVRVDLVRATRENLPMARLFLGAAPDGADSGAATAESFAAEYPNILGSVPAHYLLDATTLAALEGLIRPAVERRSLPRALTGGWRRKAADPAVSVARAERPAVRRPRPAPPVSPAQGAGNAAGIGMRLTLQWLAPLLVVGAAVIFGTTWWLRAGAEEAAVRDTQQRAAARTPLPQTMQDLAAGRLVESGLAAGGTARSLPPGIRRAGYESETPATDAQIADAAANLEITKINRSAFRSEGGRRTCDIQVYLANKSDVTLPVVALLIGIRDKANLNVDERVLKVERRWVGPGGVRVVEGQLSDLPKWAQSISVKISPTKA
jgi:hypothetical protein